MTEPISIAVLGTGIMGAAIARNLSHAGHDVRVWNRSTEKARPLAADGATVAATPADAVAGADVVLTMVYDGPAVLEAMTAAGPGLIPGTLWVQSTTVGVGDIAPMAELAHELGVVFVDAPVLGTKGPAEDGQLLVLAAAPQEARERLAPLFDTIGRRTDWVGDDGASGAATRLKLVCNSWVQALTHGTAEALALAKGLGVDPQRFLAAMAGGAMDTGYLRNKSAVILEGDYTPSFSLGGALKDAGLILAAAEAGGVRLDVAAAGAERFRRAEERGHGDEDMAATYFASFDD